MQKIKPHQVLLQDLADPHGTHEVCLNTILAAMKQLKSNHTCMIAGCGCIAVLGMSGNFTKSIWQCL
jgi:hypothetical protein